MFTSRMKLAEVVQANFNTLSVINRFGIKLGFGDFSVHKVCEANGVNVDFFLEILNAFHDKNYFPQEQLQSFSVAEIVSYLRKTHQDYMYQNIPHVEMLLEQLEVDCSKPDEIKLVHNFFNEYKDELFKHLLWEDDKIFPYAQSVEHAYINGSNVKQIVEAIRAYPMSNFLDEHDDIESKLNDINILFVKYLPPVYNQHLCIRILREFSILEQDINNHSRIEEKVLAPKVIKMEKFLLKQHE
ncbi:MAG: hemerythrin domain-containing protein [Bacteroidales bacterium]|nr:hemerythrin domain-containing protein [Bacteroidales bacterium]MDD3892076.1 hemerythrin domain-containing protein [Bacteroidales bacterium]